MSKQAQAHWPQLHAEKVFRLVKTDLQCDLSALGVARADNLKVISR